MSRNVRYAAKLLMWDLCFICLSIYCKKCRHLLPQVWILDFPSLCLISLGIFYFHFRSTLYICKYFFSVLKHFSFDSYLLSSLGFVSFLFLLLLIFSFYPLCSSRMSDVNSVFLYLLRFALFPNYVVNSGEISMSCWNAVYSFVYEKIFCRYLLGPFTLWSQLAPEILFLIFICVICYWQEWGFEDTSYQCVRVNINYII